MKVCAATALMRRHTGEAVASIRHDALGVPSLDGETALPSLTAQSNGEPKFCMGGRLPGVHKMPTTVSSTEARPGWKRNQIDASEL